MTEQAELVGPEAGPTFQTPYGPGRMSKVFTLRDDQAVLLFEPEIVVVDSPEFQRLAGIKQLGTAHLVFRCATHTRWEHSLGTLDAAQRIIDATNQNPKALRHIGATACRLARLGALLHDITHIPFGHTLEDELNLVERHDRSSQRLHRFVETGSIGAALRDELGDRRYGETNEYELLLALLRAVEDEDAQALGDLAYVADIVGNTVCADALDYVPRDLAACGMPVPIGERFLHYFVITEDGQPSPVDSNRMALRIDKRGMPRPDVETEVHKLLDARYQLVERVFFHHAKNAGSVMLGRAFQELDLDLTDPDALCLSDETLLLALAVPGVADALQLPCTDDEERRARAASLAGGILVRRLYKLVYLGVADDDVTQKAETLYTRYGADPKARRALEQDLAAQAGLDDGEVLIHVPNPKMLTKPAKVRMVLEDGNVTDLERWDRRHSGRLTALRRAHERLWRIAVYVHPRALADGRTIELLIAGAKSSFGLRTRYARRPALDEYFATLFEQRASEREWPADIRAEAVDMAAVMAGEAVVAGQQTSRSLDASLALLQVAVERVLASRHA